MSIHTIWNSEVNIKDYKDFLQEEYPKIEDEKEKFKIVNDLNFSYLEDEKENLNIQIQGRILAIADLGLWNGRKNGYKILPNNIQNILNTNCDSAHWYCDQYNLKFTGIHHDGTNFIEYREIREDRDIDKLLLKIYNNQEISRKEINYYTKSIRPYIKKVYGW